MAAKVMAVKNQKGSLSGCHTSVGVTFCFRFSIDVKFRVD